MTTELTTQQICDQMSDAFNRLNDTLNRLNETFKQYNEMMKKAGPPYRYG